MANKEFGNTLRQLRLEKSYTQQQAADLLGLTNKSTLGSWEIGKSEPDGYTFLKLCRIYEVKDIYSAFGEISPTKIASDINAEFIENFSMLSDDSKKIVQNLMSELLEMQKKGKQ